MLYQAWCFLLAYGQRYQQIEIVLAITGAVSGTVTDSLAATSALMDHNISFSWVRFGFDGAHESSASVGTVTRVDVHVQGIQTEGAMITRGEP